ncbi:hypothetical protein TRAPUB_3323 [Trametes pubescens]|uniref:Protein kinase domain-containing protein n=1 Tax=Trametes pubescens TaxID=154538 RepID=A0A1M2VE61_TRAPU|nr:hypothetical protein TRAPUB_3323 [Trametes pubescens]
MRFVVDTVGLPLSEFRSTKELAMAIRDAIKDHRLMMERGGVLHRDVSSGNILIVEEPQERPSSKGILHDYDYSSMTPYPPSKAFQGASSDSPLLRPLELADDCEDVGGCKERTGTYHFMAVELLDPIVKGIDHDSPHDIESFFWVLLWIVLRHTDHRYEGGKQGCEHVFKYGNDVEATGAKRAWLFRSIALDPVLVITGNAPLTDLLNSFHVLVYDATMTKMADRVPLTYASVLDIFDAAIARDDWPVGDKALPFKLTDNRTKHTVVRTQVQTGDEDGRSNNAKKRSRTALENDGAQSDSSEDDDEMESMLSLLASAPTTMVPAKRLKMIPPMLGRRE